MRMMSHQRLPKPRFEIRAEQNADGGASVSKSDDGDVDDGDVIMTIMIVMLMVVMVIMTMMMIVMMAYLAQ